MTEDVFHRFRQDVDQSGISAIDHLVEQFRTEKQHFQLFEALKLRARYRLGLPLMHPPAGEELTEEQRTQLEDELVAACEEVGRMLLDQGRIREGWYYLRPVGDNRPVIEALEQAEVDDENLEDLIEVALFERVAPELGFSLILEHHGTCNAVTTYEQHLAALPPELQKPMAACLLEHVYEELVATVIADISHQEGSEPTEKSLSEMIANRDWLFANSGYHIDTSHLAATVRFARVLSQPAHLEKALQLVDYGSRLDPAFQYQQVAPFEELYPSHRMYFRVLLGEEVEAGLAYFRKRAESSDVRREGSLAVETYVELLAKLGRGREALETALRLIPPGIHTVGIAPTPVQLSQQANDFSLLASYAQQQGDLLTFATALLLERQASDK